MIDVQQMALALRACTSRSLVIVDEFGKGTESNGSIKQTRLIVDGAGLFCAVLEHFLKLETQRPKVLMVLHSKSNRGNTLSWYSSSQLMRNS
jgi:DNA mismatch repair protein MSH5